MFSDKFFKFIEIWQKEFAMDKTLDEKVCIDKDGNPIPWYTFPAIEYLSQFDWSDKKIFEFGCGNSSRFWAKRADRVISVEDNQEWLDKWNREFSESNIEIRFREEGEKYYNAILEDEELYDIIVVDGKNRAECAENALKKLADGGMIIFDDSDRVNASSNYARAGEILKSSNLIQVDFYGFCPMSIYSKNTSIFLSRNIQLKSIHKNQPAPGIGNIWHLPKKDRKEYF